MEIIPLKEAVKRIMIAEKKTNRDARNYIARTQISSTVKKIDGKSVRVIDYDAIQEFYTLRKDNRQYNGANLLLKPQSPKELEELKIEVERQKLKNAQLKDREIQSQLIQQGRDEAFLIVYKFLFVLKQKMIGLKKESPKLINGINKAIDKALKDAQAETTITAISDIFTTD